MGVLSKDGKIRSAVFPLEVLTQRHKWQLIVHQALYSELPPPISVLCRIVRQALYSILPSTTLSVQSYSPPCSASLYYHPPSSVRDLTLSYSHVYSVLPFTQLCRLVKACILFYSPLCSVLDHAVHQVVLYPPPGSACRHNAPSSVLCLTVPSFLLCFTIHQALYSVLLSTKLCTLSCHPPSLLLCLPVHYDLHPVLTSTITCTLS